MRFASSKKLPFFDGLSDKRYRFEIHISELFGLNKILRLAHGSRPHQRQPIPVRGVTGRAPLLFHAPLPLLTRQSGAG